MNNFKWINNYARTSALTYAEAFLEACAKLKIKDPLAALIDTDDYPKLRTISEVEFAIGWLHGCAECHGVTIEVILIWAEVGSKRFSRAKGRVA
jgi:hypothetical protein